MNTIAGDYPGFQVAVDGGVAVLTFTRPDRLNALSIAMRRDLIEVLTACQIDDGVRVVILTGSGKSFCAGMWLRPNGDEPSLVPDVRIDRHAPINLSGLLRSYSQELVRTIRRLDKLTIAAVNGHAIQIGLSMALACDYVIVARSARLGSATLRMGYQPDEGGHWLLVEHLGVKRALDFMMRKHIVDGPTAAQMGLATECVDDDQLLCRAGEIASELAAGPQVAMRLLKRAVYNAAQLTLEQAGDDIAVRTGISDFHPDAVDGARAWLRKETPEFNHWLDQN